jgi:hypothetical protein
MERLPFQANAEFRDFMREFEARHREAAREPVES